MEVVLVERDDEFARLESAWRELAAMCGARVFQQFEWAHTWFRTIGRKDNHGLCVATGWDGSRLVAVLPLTIRRYNGVRLAEWMGARTGDYLDALIHPQFDPVKSVESLWQVLRRRKIDIVRFGQVRTDALIHPWLEQEGAWVETHEESVGIPIVWSSGQQWLEAQSTSQQSGFRRRGRKLEHLGLSFNVWQPSEPLDPVLDFLIAHKRAWMQSHSQDGFLKTDDGAEFLRDTARSLACRGMLHVSYIRSKEAIAACHVGFLQDNVLSYYIPAYDEKFTKQSVGTVLLDRLVMWACDQGLRRLDLLRGMYDYKERYDISSESLETRTLAVSPVGRVALSAYQWARRLRQFRVRTVQEHASA